MRGKAGACNRSRSLCRITPAHAGKSPENLRFHSCRQDHPRTCGEKHGAPVSLRCSAGSPPHMRGKAISSNSRTENAGITPAHAGKSAVSMLLIFRRRDHPRTCGEKWYNAAQSWNQMGSPPHMRGKVLMVYVTFASSGITPAHAGKSEKKLHGAANQKDHPRTCGEKMKCLKLSHMIRGSPPHMRGKAGCRCFQSPEGRITPAHAGKRLKRSRSIVPHAAIVPLFPSVCNKPAGSDGSPAGHDAPPFLPIENAAPASPAYNLRSL